MFYADYRGKLPKKFNVYQIGDTHIGNIALATSSLKKAIKIIKDDPIGRFGFMGDATDSVHVFDKRYSNVVAQGKFATANKQTKEVARLFEPIMPKCLFWLDGNHEETIEDTVNIADMIFDNFDFPVPHGGRSCKCLLTDKIFWWATHAKVSINSKAGDREQRLRWDGIKVKRNLRDFQSDCILNGMGHIHKVRIVEPIKRLMIVGALKAKQKYSEPVYGPSGELNEDDCYYFSSGAFLRTLMEGVTTYSEKAGYPPVEMGMIKVSISGDKVLGIEKIYV